MAAERCVVCEKQIHRANNSRCHKLRRGPHSVTCSRKCARIYRRENLWNKVVISRIEKPKIPKDKQKWLTHPVSFYLGGLETKRRFINLRILVLFD